MVQKVAVSHEFEARLCHAATGKLSLSTQQKMGTFFELGKDKAAKGEGWAPPFISCAQDTVGLPLPLRLLGYGTPLPFTLFNKHCPEICCFSNLDLMVLLITLKLLKIWTVV